MRLGVSPYGSTREEAVGLAAAALDAGFEVLWLGDGIFRRPDFARWRGGMESMTELAWLAGRFPAAAIGITAAVLPLRDVEWLAREACTLDHLSGGRFTLAVAAGFWADELSHRGIDPGRRGAELRARLARLRDHFDPDGVLSPPPLTPGGPPVWLAGAEPTMRLALDLGLPFQASRALPADLAPLAARWFDAGGGLLAHRIYVEAGGASEAEQYRRHALSGSASALADGIAAYAAMGVGDLSLVLGHDDASARRALDALVSAVPDLTATGAAVRQAR